MPLGELPLQLVMAPPRTTDGPVHRKVLLPRREAAPQLHETLARHRFQLEQAPLSCQDIPAWLQRMHERQLAMPICPGLMPPGWIEAQSLIPHPGQPPLRETLWLLLPEGRLLRSATTRHLIRTLRQRVEKAEEAWIPWLDDDPVEEGSEAAPSIKQRNSKR